MNSKPNIWQWLCQPIVEIALGIWHRRISWGPIYLWSAWVMLCFLCRWDVWLWKKFFITQLYPRVPYLYWPYTMFWVTSGLWAWALFQTGLRFNLIKKLTEVFTNAGLKNRMGKLPGFVSDYPMDSMNRKLKITTASFPKSKFEEVKPYVESGLQIYIDDIKETRERGLIEMTYSHHPMPSRFNYSEVKFGSKSHEFLIGATRTSIKKSNFEENPHLLIAGRSGRGKSTLLRQLITHLYIKNENTKFMLIDLKGGLEFQTFENLPRALVVGSIETAVGELKELQKELKRRFDLIKKSGCKDIQAYQQKMLKEKTTITLYPYIIVVDEIAEIFMVNNKNSGVDIQACKTALSQISRLGRAVGMHLVAATQRPDKQALDSQVKANLSGVLCFHMMDDQSSILVLGNGRATDLPLNVGRAIWKDSIEMSEVQTPMLSIEEANTLLAPYRVMQKPIETKVVEDVNCEQTETESYHSETNYQ